MKPLRLEIPGKPIAKARPRFVRRGKFVATYNAQETEEGKFIIQVMQQHKGPVIDAPIELHCFFDMPIPKSTSKKKRALMLKNEIKHTKKPDIDNHVKFAMDCLNGIVWRDDSQVTALKAWKEYSDNPKTVIVVHAQEGV